MPIDHDESVRVLASAFIAGTPVYVLVDPLVGEPIPVDSGGVAASLKEATHARALAWGREIEPVELAPVIDLAPCFYPYLVALHGADDPWLDDTLAIAQAERIDSQAEGLAGRGSAVMRIGGWLHASAAAPDIAAALSINLRVRCESPVKLRYQRLTDRRALAWAHCVAGDARMRAALGPIHQWTYLDATGGFRNICRSGEASVPLRWAAHEWPTFMQGDLIHQTLARYLGELAQRGRASTAPESELLRRAQAALMRAAAARARWPNHFTAPQDDTAWAALLLLHGDISASPLVARALQARADGEPATPLHEIAPSLNELLCEPRT